MMSVDVMDDNSTAGIVAMSSERNLAKEDENKVSLTTWKDLSEAGVSKHDIFELFRKHFGKTPHKVHLNDGICNDYDNHCYNYQGGEVEFNNQKTEVLQRIANSRQLSNDVPDGQPATYTVELQSSKEKSATVTVNQTSGISVGTKFTIGSEQLGISNEFSASFDLTNSVGSSTTTREIITVKDTIQVVLNPGKTVIVDLQLEWKSLKEDFKIPFHIKGWVGASYESRVKGHYYWFLNLVLLPSGLPKVAYLKGTVETTYDIKGKIQMHAHK